MKVLHLHLKREYFASEKNEEYRRDKPYWTDRLVAREYDEIWLYRGYPSAGDAKNIIRRKWRGYRLLTITHPEFGKKPIQVFAIDVSVPA